MGSIAVSCLFGIGLGLTVAKADELIVNLVDLLVGGGLGRYRSWAFALSVVCCPYG